jgi:predicted small integral membrane protein
MVLCLMKLEIFLNILILVIEIILNIIMSLGATAFYIVRKEANQTKNGKKLFVPYSYDESTQDWV